jgi:hypothetical protein
MLFVTRGRHCWLVQQCLPRGRVFLRERRRTRDIVHGRSRPAWAQRRRRLGWRVSAGHVLCPVAALLDKGAVAHARFTAFSQDGQVRRQENYNLACSRRYLSFVVLAPAI